MKKRLQLSIALPILLVASRPASAQLTEILTAPLTDVYTLMTTLIAGVIIVAGLVWAAGQAAGRNFQGAAVSVVATLCVAFIVGFHEILLQTAGIQFGG